MLAQPEEGKSIASGKATSALSDVHVLHAVGDSGSYYASIDAADADDLRGDGARQIYV